MKLLSISTSKAIWLFPTNDLNPRGEHVDGILEALRDRYRFEVMPTQQQLLEFATKKQAIPFGMGRFESSQGVVNLALTYFHDGIMAETRAGTDVGDEAVADVLTLLTGRIQADGIDSLTIRRIYSTELYVRLDKGLSFINPQIGKLGRKIAERANWPNPTAAFEVTGLTFGPDPISKSQHPAFRLERDGSAAFEDDRYFSAAPMKTNDHLEVLEQIESALLQGQ